MHNHINLGLKVATKHLDRNMSMEAEATDSAAPCLRGISSPENWMSCPGPVKHLRVIVGLPDTDGGGGAL